MWSWFYSCIPGGPEGRTALASITFFRYINRLVDTAGLTASGRANLLALQGHLYMLCGSFEEALRSYLLIDDDDDEDKSPDRNLLLGVAYYNRAQQRTCPSQRWYFL
jgi:hypothetical protein